MSKKKPATKSKAKKSPMTKSAPSKAAPRKKAAARKAPTPAVSSAVPSNRTAAATIFLYKTDGGHRVRTSPQLLPAGPGFIEWTVVNLTSDEHVDVEISWPEGGPWGDAPIYIKGGNARVSCQGAKDGRYKYNVTANGYTEDPEVDIPWN